MHLRTIVPFFRVDDQKVTCGVILVPTSVTCGGTSAFREALSSCALGEQRNTKALPPVGETLSGGALQPTLKFLFTPGRFSEKGHRD